MNRLCIKEPQHLLFIRGTPTLRPFSPDANLNTSLLLESVAVGTVCEHLSWSQSVQTPALEAGMILTGIGLRSALLNLWVLTQPRVESEFPSAA